MEDKGVRILVHLDELNCDLSLLLAGEVLKAWVLSEYFADNSVHRLQHLLVVLCDCLHFDLSWRPSRLPDLIFKLAYLLDALLQLFVRLQVQSRLEALVQLDGDDFCGVHWLNSNLAAQTLRFLYLVEGPVVLLLLYQVLVMIGLLLSLKRFNVLSHFYNC